jgi:hypothetical protein
LIYLAFAWSDPKRVSRAVRTGATPVRWAYLGRNFGRTRAWEDALGSRFTRVSFSARLQELAWSWREKFLDWIADVSLHHKDDLSWWSSAIAEKNTLSDSLYHGVCYLKIAIELAAVNGPLLLVAEHEGLLQAIEANVAQPSKRVGFTPREELRLWARFIHNWIRYGLRSFAELRAARTTRTAIGEDADSNTAPSVVIHTCIDESYFGADGQPRDRYFGPLPAMLREQGYDVRTLPWLFAVRRPLREAIGWFRSRSGEYLLPEDDYTMADYIWAARVVIAQFWRGRELTYFQGLAMRALVRCARLEQAGSESIARFVRYDRLVRRWAARGKRVDVFIDMFENMASEKAQVMAFRDAMPETMTVGFQHYAALPPLQLFLRSTSEEAQVAPIPDVIVCNSPYTARQLVDTGFPTERLRVGASLRYPHLTHPSIPLERPRGRNVLVVLPLEENAAQELLLKLLDAFHGDLSVSFRVKVHPMAPREFLGGVLDRMPPTFSLVGGELASHLREVACAVVLASTSAFELAVAGVPLVIAGRESDFDQNPLALHSEFPSPVVSPEQLRVAILQRLELSQPEWERLREWALRMRREAFVPISPDSIRVFVERNDLNLQSANQHVEAW